MRNSTHNKGCKRSRFLTRKRREVEHMSEGGFVFHVKDERVVPIDWNEYARISSLGFNLLPKWNVAAALLFLAVDYGKMPDPSLEKLWTHLKADDMPAHRQIFAMESVSTTMALIENFCA